MQLFETQFKALGGKSIIKLFAKDASHAEHAFHIAKKEIERIEQKYSRYRADSVVSQINSQAFHSAFCVDQETADLLNYADSCFTQSQGLFDITSGVLRKIWDFSKPGLPSQEQLAQTLELIGWQKVKWHDSKIQFTQNEMQIDFGGIGKEYAVDRVSTLFHQLNIEHALINLSGDLKVTGPRADGKPWLVGVQHPRAAGSICDVQLSHGGLATSGDYERYFKLAGQRYCHIMNAKTGWPVQDLQSVSVYNESCLVAGSIATITMLLGEYAGKQFLQTNQVKFLMINRAGEKSLGHPHL